MSGILIKELSWMIAHHCEIPPSPCPRSEPRFSLAVRERYENRRKNGHYRLISRVTANKKSARCERFNYRMWDLLRVYNRQSFADATYVIYVQYIDNQCVFVRQNVFGGQTRDKNSHTKRKKNNKTISKKHTEISGPYLSLTLLFCLPLGLKVRFGVNSKITKSLYI